MRRKAQFSSNTVFNTHILFDLLKISSNVPSEKFESWKKKEKKKEKVPRHRGPTQDRGTAWLHAGVETGASGTSVGPPPGVRVAPTVRD